MIIKKSILVVIAHPDDETIGCGGAISNHVKNGDKVHCVYMSDGVSSREKKKNDLLINKRKNNAIRAAKILGFKWLFEFSGRFSDNKMDNVSLLKIVKVIEDIKKKINPHIIYTHFPYDLNVDHQAVANATMTAFRPQSDERWEKILSFEIPSSTDFAYFKNKSFSPNYFININKFWKKKKKALLCYGNEIKKYPNSRSLKGIEILSRLRGVESGLNQAEAFQILREIRR
jgi:LmbE family N-acetylglucosaminyl deacetylase